MAASSILGRMKKVGEQVVPTVGEAHSSFKKHPLVVTADTYLLILGAGTAMGCYIRPVYYYLYHKATGEPHVELIRAGKIHVLPEKVDNLEQKFKKMEEQKLPARVEALEKKVKQLEESRNTTFPWNIFRRA